MIPGRGLKKRKERKRGQEGDCGVLFKGMALWECCARIMSTAGL